jgi:hypothetical protein
MCELREARRRKQTTPAFMARFIMNLGMPDLCMTSYPFIMGPFAYKSCATFMPRDGSEIRNMTIRGGRHTQPTNADE